MNLYDIAIAKKLSGGGGGGSSDFSTAEVTLNLTLEGGGDRTIVETSMEVLSVDYPDENFSYACSHLPSLNDICQVLMYRGIGYAESVGATDNLDETWERIVGTPVTSGGVNWNSELQQFEITGDGTITATLSIL